MRIKYNQDSPVLFCPFNTNTKFRSYQWPLNVFFQSLAEILYFFPRYFFIFPSCFFFDLLLYLLFSLIFWYFSVTLFLTLHKLLGLLIFLLPVLYRSCLLSSCSLISPQSCVSCGLILFSPSVWLLLLLTKVYGLSSSHLRWPKFKTLIYLNQHSHWTSNISAVCLLSRIIHIIWASSHTQKWLNILFLLPNYLLANTKWRKMMKSGHLGIKCADIALFC